MNTRSLTEPLTNSIKLCKYVEKFISSEKVSKPQVHIEQSSVSAENSNEIIDKIISGLTEDEVVVFMDRYYNRCSNFI